MSDLYEPSADCDGFRHVFNYGAQAADVDTPYECIAEKCSAVLIPVVKVELDYDAAWSAFVRNENHEPTECACTCTHNTEQAVQRAVDAALKGTTNDNAP